MFSVVDVENLKAWVKNSWPASVRRNTEGSGTLIGLPYSYTVPCADGMFQEMYYWDTYFTNQGLRRQGYEEFVKSNADNMLYLVEEYGYMPNGNRTYYLNRSQPPYLSMIVRDVYEIFRDEEWLRSAHATLKKEYDFWMTKRATPIGLNRHYHHASPAELREFFEYVANRLNSCRDVSDEKEKLETAAHFLAEGETGWDFTPRFGGRCADFAPIDLNCNLYLYEKNFAWFSEILGTGEAASWRERAERRKALINQFCWNDEKGLFCDYNFVSGKQSEVPSLASFAPMWAGLATDKQAQALRENLVLFECDFGLATCQKGPRENKYQWDYPNGWPPLFYLVIQGLNNYGFKDDARRIAQKYVDLVITNFKISGHLWEKYNVVDGSTRVVNEYEMPTMLGWTAGVFIYASELVGGAEA